MARHATVLREPPKQTPRQPAAEGRRDRYELTDQRLAEGLHILAGLSLPGTCAWPIWPGCCRGSPSAGWGIEAGVAIVAAVIAGSAALLGFGLDSGIEALASIIVIWRFTGTRLTGATAERRAQQLVAMSFYLLPPTLPPRRSGD